jgi:hypothetical protein
MRTARAIAEFGHVPAIRQRFLALRQRLAAAALVPRFAVYPAQSRSSGTAKRRT